LSEAIIVGPNANAEPSSTRRNPGMLIVAEEV
jgi:hypothetical protein